MSTLSEARHSEAKRAFLEVCDLEGDARDAFLDRLSKDDPELSLLVDRLLAHDEANGADTMPGAAVARGGVMVGDRLGPYLILSRLGGGAQGTVYLAEDGRLGRRVALKILDATGAHDASQMEDRMRHFWREAEITSSLDHAGICAVFDAGMIDGVAYIAMRWIHGETLADRIAAARRQGPGPGEWIDAILERFEKIGRALHAAHENGVIHRDVKPGNIMVTPEGEPVILDFGLARSVASTRPASSIGALRGTPEYMSPEQLAADRIDLDRRTDVFSLGVTLFESLTLQRPFRGGTPEALYHAIMTKEPPDPRPLNRAIEPDLRIVLQTALQKDRDHRYRSALELAADLRHVRLHEPIDARHTGPITRLRRWAQRNPLAAMAAAAIIFLLSGVILLVGLLSGKIAERRLQEGREQSERAYRLVSEADAMLKRDPARARRILNQALAAAPGLPVGDLALEIASKLRGKTYLVGHDSEVVDAAFSFDGTRVITGSLDGTARTWDAGSGALTAAMAVAPDRKIRAVGWIAGEPVVVTSGEDHAVTLISFNGRVLRAFPAHAQRVTAVSLSRDGQRLLTASSDGTTRVQSVGTQSPPWVIRDDAPTVSATFNWDETRVVTVSEDGRVQIFSNERDAPAIFGPTIDVKDDLGDSGASWRARSAALGATVLAIVQANSSGAHRLITLDTNARSAAVEWGRHDPHAPLAFSPDGADLVTTVDQRAVIRRAATGETVAPIPENPGALRKAAFSPQGGRLLTTSLEGPAIVWSLQDMTQVLTLGNNSEVPLAWDAALAANVAIAFAGPVGEKPPTWGDVRGVSPDGRLIATATGPAGASGDVVRIYDASTRKVVHSLADADSSVPSVSFSHDGAVCAIVDNVGPSLVVRSLVSGSPLLTVPKSRNPDLVTLSPNGRFVVARVDPQAADSANRARRDSSVLAAWDLEKGGERILVRSAANVASITFSPDGDGVFVVAAPGVAMLFDLPHDARDIALAGAQRPSGAAAFSPDGTCVAAATVDHAIAVWMTATGELVTRATGHRQAVGHIAFSPDGRLLVSASAADRTLRTWDAANGTQITSAPVSELRFACFSPRGDEVVAVAREGSTDRVRVLAASSGNERWRPRSGSFYGFSPDGRWIVVFTCDGDFEQFPLDPIEEISR